MKNMNSTSKLNAFLLGVAVVAAVFLGSAMPGGLWVGPAEARVGRPMTPVSVAGVARRTTRRAIRRSTVYVATLPQSCSVVNVDGTTLYLCGSTYYQSHQGQYVVVYVE